MELIEDGDVHEALKRAIDEERKHPSILSSFIQRQTRRFEINNKANEIVMPYGYTASLFEKVIPDKIVEKHIIVLVVDTKGAFPGTAFLSQLSAELAKATGLSLEQISFCLFCETKESQTE